MDCPYCSNELMTLSTTCDCGEDPFSGKVLNDRYKLLGLTARGGMAVICRGLDLEDDSLRAIKISRWGETLREIRQLEPTEARKEERARVDREFTLLQKASTLSSNVVAVYEEVMEDEELGLYYPMEFLAGLPLDLVPEWWRPFPPHRALAIALQVCEAVSIAHGLGVVHRDLNPGNIFLVKDEDGLDRVKIIDFGIARSLYERRKLFQTGDDIAFGSLHFLSPEQAGYSASTDAYSQETAAALDHRADIYAVGVILFCMLTGSTPFPETDESVEELAARDWCNPRPFGSLVDLEGVPTGLEALVMSCIHADPDCRPPDALVLADLLREASSAIPEDAAAAPILVGKKPPPPPVAAVEPPPSVGKEAAADEPEPVDGPGEKQEASAGEPDGDAETLPREEPERLGEEEQGRSISQEGEDRDGEDAGATDADAGEGAVAEGEGQEVVQEGAVAEGEGQEDEQQEGSPLPEGPLPEIGSLSAEHPAVDVEAVAGEKPEGRTDEGASSKQKEAQEHLQPAPVPVPSRRGEKIVWISIVALLVFSFGAFTAWFFLFGRFLAKQ